jgi:MFS family permease
MATATADAKPPLSQPVGTAPGDQPRFIALSLAIFSASVPLLLAALALHMGLLTPYYAGDMETWRAAILGLPVLLAGGLCLTFGLLLFGVRRAWPIYGCAISGVIFSAAYALSAYYVFGRVPTDWGGTGWATWCFAGVGAIILAMTPAALAEMRTGPLPVLQFSPRVQKVGTLRYSAFGLFVVFFWLLWGDFVVTLLDGNVPGILFVKLNQLGAGDTLNSVLNKTLAYAIAFLFAPAVSFRSDRHRGPMGRRIPYLLYSTPFVGLFLVLIGYYDGLTNVFMGNAAEITLLGMTFSRAAVTIFVFAVIFVAFDFSNIFVGTVYWYLFNDVVPPRLMSQFLSLFRIVGTAAGMIYSGLIFPHALTHFRLIFTVAGIAYVVGFVLMCFMVKEGKYPPPPPLVDERKGQKGPVEQALAGLGLGAIGRWMDNFAVQMKTYAKECFTHRFYWYFFLTSTCIFMSWQAGNFQILRNLNSLKLTMTDLGFMGVWTSLVSLLLQYPAGWLSDRINPIRVYFVTTIICVFGSVAQCAFLFGSWTPHASLVYMYILSFTVMPFGALQGAAELPMYMRLLPKERYGQFCSANAMVRSFAMMFGSVLAGMFMEVLLKNYLGMDDFRYRYYPVWVVAFQILACVFLTLMYRYWKSRGGDNGYTPPDTSAAAGNETATTA